MTELEVVMMDWMAKLLHLPKEFTHASHEGGGVIQVNSTSVDHQSFLCFHFYQFVNPVETAICDALWLWWYPYGRLNYKYAVSAQCLRLVIIYTYIRIYI